MATTTRAKKGGEFGANGEWYEGGKFINTTPENAKRYGSTTKGSGKQEIAPYVWEVAPEGMRSIYKQIAGICAKFDRASMQFIYAANPQILNYIGRTQAECEDLIARYNAGERWISR